MRNPLSGIPYPSTPFLRFRFVTLSLIASVVFTCFFGMAASAQAQAAATMQGTLTDVSDAAVAGASINVQGLSSPANQAQGVSGNDGRFHLEVPPGRYRLTITHDALKPFEQVLELHAGEIRELHARLEIEPLSASVVVSAEAQPIAATAASEPVDIVTRDEIAQRQAVELAPLLETLPGFSLGQTGPVGGVGSLFLDGGNSNFTKVLVDGIPANQPGGAIDFSNFTLEGVDKIEVVHGAQSALSGSDAVTGTIEILTHRGSTRTPLLVVDSEGGSFDTGRGAAQLSGLVGRFDYSATAAYFETAGQGVDDRFLNRTLSGNFGVHLTEQDSLRLTVRDNTSDAGEPGQTLFTPPNLDAHNGLHNLMAGLTWDFATGRTGSTTFGLLKPTCISYFRICSAIIFFRPILSTSAVLCGRPKRSPRPIVTFPTIRAINTAAPNWGLNRLTPPASSPSAPATNMKSKMRFLPIWMDSTRGATTRPDFSMAAGSQRQGWF